jgi:hypothetical protein
VLAEHRINLRDADDHAARGEPGGDGRRVAADPRGVNDLEQDLDHQRGRRRGRGGGHGRAELAAPRPLRARSPRDGAHVEVLVGEALADEPLGAHEVQQRVVHPDLQTRPQLALEQAALGALDQDRHRVLERPVAREAHARVQPEPVGIELRDVRQRVVPPRVAVAGQIAQLGEPAKRRHR